MYSLPTHATGFCTIQSKSTSSIWYQTLLVLFSPFSSTTPPSPTTDLLKIEVVYILLLGFSSFPFSSTEITSYIFDEKKTQTCSVHYVGQNTCVSLQICILSNTVNTDQQQTPEPIQEQKIQASENSDLLIADKSLL